MIILQRTLVVFLSLSKLWRERLGRAVQHKKEDGCVKMMNLGHVWGNYMVN